MMPFLPPCSPPLQGDDAGTLATTLPQLTELDLTSNLLPDWSSVQQLAMALPALRILNLTDNLLRLPASVAAVAPMTILPGLTALVLNNCRVSWQQVSGR